MNYYPFGLRNNYDPTIGRWGSVDPMAALYNSTSPYHFVGNNPVKNYEVDGGVFFDNIFHFSDGGTYTEVTDSDVDYHYYVDATADQFVSEMGGFEKTYLGETAKGEPLSVLANLTVIGGAANISSAGLAGGGADVLQAGVNSDYLSNLTKAMSTASYLAGTSLDVNQLYRGQVAYKAYLNDSRRALNRAYPGYFKGLSRTTTRAISNYKIARAVAGGLSKPLFGVGLVLTGADIYQNDFSTSSIAWGVADTGIALAALVASGPAAPFVVIGATIYFTGRFAYGVYDAYNQGK